MVQESGSAVLMRRGSLHANGDVLGIGNTPVAVAVNAQEPRHAEPLKHHQNGLTKLNREQSYRLGLLVVIQVPDVSRYL